MTTIIDLKGADAEEIMIGRVSLATKDGNLKNHLIYTAATMVVLEEGVRQLSNIAADMIKCADRKVPPQDVLISLLKALRDMRNDMEESVDAVRTTQMAIIENAHPDLEDRLFGCMVECDGAMQLPPAPINVTIVAKQED